MRPRQRQNRQAEHANRACLVYAQAQALVRVLLAEGQLKSPRNWLLFNFKDAHGCEEFRKHVKRADCGEQLDMIYRLSSGKLPIEVPDDSGWFLVMPNGYAVEGRGLEGRTWIGKTEAVMPRLQRVDNPYMTEQQLRMWRRGL